jgi:prepilin-type N-terminal cleavage/methylation domain-containing protein
MKRKKSGFTLTELLIVMMIILIVIGGMGIGIIRGILLGNEWYTESGVLKEIQVTHPEAQKILTSHRCAYHHSKFIVENKDGSRREYYLKSNIFFNYDIVETQ